MAKQQNAIAFRHLNTLLNVGAIGGLTDRELLTLFTTRRDEVAELAFAVLVDRHGPMVLRVCQAVLRDSHDAQDAFQATFLVLVRKARGLWVRECLGPWLHQVAHRTASCARSARSRRRRHERLAAALPVDIAVSEDHDDLLEVLHEEVGRLPERYRAPVVLCLFEGLTPEQAARQLGWPAGTVHSRLARGRSRLRDRLSRRGLAPGMEGTDAVLTVHRAAVPAALAAATKLAATRFAAGETLAGIVSASIVPLTKETLRSLMVTKLSFTGIATVAMGVAVATATALGYQAPAPEAASLPLGQASGKAEAVQDETQPPEVAIEQATPDGVPLSLAISRDGTTLASGWTDSSVQLLDAHTGEKRGAFAGTSQGYVRGLAFAPDGKTIWCVCDDNRLRLREVATGASMKELTALGVEQAGLPRVLPNSLALSPDGGLIAVGGGGSTGNARVVGPFATTFFEVRIRDTKTGELVWSHLGRRAFMYQLAFSPDGKTLAGAVGDEVKLWDAGAGEPKQALKPASGDVWTLAFSPNNRLLAGYGTGRVDGQRAGWLTLWDVRSGVVVHSIKEDKPSGNTAPVLAFSPDSRSLAIAGFGIGPRRISIEGRDFMTKEKTVIKQIKLFDVTAATIAWTAAVYSPGPVDSLVFSPDGEALFFCDMAAITRIDARTGQNRRDLMTVTNVEVRPR